MSMIAVFYQSVAATLRPLWLSGNVRHLIHIVARMLLISLYINTLAGKSALTGIDCERPQKNMPLTKSSS
jgi:transcriptional regulator with GAF, ATPase, and Fis domain